MEKKDVSIKVIGLIAAQMNKDVKTITGATNIMEDLKADSLDVVEMLMKLEDEFGVTIPDEEAMNMKTVGDLIKFVEKNI
ncbi:MAG: acyl carrier protein [Firmicutes bacterium]|nr:acyl carrier protein [Bacillota bacterium]